ncbi:MAG: DUF1080 domain-containing protein [Planctomycetes bacterium]|nr:DUF1080 domain-containing protein [Planctomycetota bacterium]
MSRTLPLLLPVLLFLTPSQDPGYDDTPRLPDGWRVHDSKRPRPPIVDAAGSMPGDAIGLFTGTDLSAFRGRDGAATWTVRDGAMEPNGSGDIETRREFGDCQIHLEWAAPSPCHGESQGRGNSGVFFLGRYEVQILDSFENPTYADGQAAALYGQTPPLVNACRRPGEWQVYDIVFVAPRFGPDGALVSPARATVFHNGLLVQHDQAFLGATAHRALPEYRAHAATGPVRLQDHGDPVRFRNVWIRPLDLTRERKG